MIKKLISVLLAAAMWTVCILPCLTGCNGGGGDGYTVAEWLDKVEMQFNMLYYNTDEPFFPNVTAESQHFDTLQIAAEWGLVDPAAGIRPDDKITKEFAADTLVSAMAFNYEADAGIADADKISDLNKVSIAVNEGVFTLDGNGRFDPQKKITREEADAAADIAYDKWVNLSYAESFDNSTVKSEVINLGGLASDKAEIAPGTYTVEYSGDLNVIDENGNYADNSTKTITFPAGTNIGVEVGSVLTLPADSQTPTPFAVVVDSVTENPDGSKTVKTHKAELYEVFEDVDVQYGGQLDLDNAVVYDMQGNRLSGGVESDNVIYAGGSELVSGASGYAQEYLVKEAKGTGSVKIGNNTTVNYKISGTEVSFSIDTKIGDDVKVKFEKKATIGVDSKLKWHWDWFKIKVDEARLALNLNEHIGGSFSYSHDFTANNGLMVVDGVGSLSGKDLAKFYDVVSSAMSLISEDMGKAAGELSAPLFKFVVPTPVGIDAEFIIRLNLSLSGEISFTMDTNAKCGLEYVNGKIRPIAEFKNNKELNIKAKAELTLFLGAGAGILGITVIDVGANIGLGAKVNSKFFQIDEVTGSVVQECAMPTGMFGGTQEGGGGLSVQLDTDMRGCVDFKAYPIVTLELCTSECLIGKFVDGLSYTVLGEDDPFYTFHYETDCGVVDACTRQTGETFTIEEGSAIELSSPDVCIAVGETYDKLMVRTVPKGYSAKDLVFTTEDAGIATAENLILGSAGSTTKVSVRKSSDGVNYSEAKYKKYTGEGNKQTKITGNADGVTMLKVSTKDGLYSAECKLLIGNGGIAERVENVFIIEEFSIKLTPGATGEVKIQSAPEGYDMSQVTFTSSDTSVATVSGSGTVTAVGEGQAVITISTTDGAYTAMCMVFVSSAGNSV